MRPPCLDACKSLKFSSRHARSINGHKSDLSGPPFFEILIIRVFVPFQHKNSCNAAARQNASRISESFFAASCTRHRSSCMFFVSSDFFLRRHLHLMRPAFPPFCAPNLSYPAVSDNPRAARNRSQAELGLEVGVKAPQARARPV